MSSGGSLGRFSVGPLDLTDKSDLAHAATVATRAFQFDPFFVHLCPAPLLRARGLAIFWRSELAAIGERGEAFAARLGDGRIVGVAIFVQPGKYPLPVRSQLRQSAGALWALWPRPRALVDGTKYLLAIDKAHPRQPLWYLNLLVTDPALQRSGIGTALQAPVMERADEEGLACYLETQNSENIAYYARFGYEVVNELQPVEAGPPLWTMLRPPRSPA